MIKIQLISDIHLEFKSTNKLPKIEPDVDILILAGDIGYHYQKKYINFLKKCNQEANKTILITGNHEYYSQAYQKVDNKIRQLVDELENVYFLQNEYLDIGNIRILGSTYWTYIPQEHSQDIMSMMNDYQRIQRKVLKDGIYRKEKITYQDVNEWHQTSKEWLKLAIKDAKEANKMVIVVTHHSPMMTEERSKYFLNYAYYSDEKELLDSGDIKLWCHGHTHQKGLTNMGKTLVWCNPWGYPDERTGYEEKAVVVLDEDGDLYF